MDDAVSYNNIDKHKSSPFFFLLFQFKKKYLFCKETGCRIYLCIYLQVAEFRMSPFKDFYSENVLLMKNENE